MIEPGAPCATMQADAANGETHWRDATNRPRMAFQRGDVGLGYAWCDANCGATSIWHARTLESTAAIIALYPPELPAQDDCPIQTWFNGVRPSLALDSAGNPRVGLFNK